MIEILDSYFTIDINVLLIGISIRHSIIFNNQW
jgi:hypothetical protein